jgi:hypothetical protein
MLGIVFYYARVYHRSDWPQGHNPAAPLGWWGWWDQGQYIKAARAFSDLNLASSEHWYPPLYALLAAPFVHWLPANPFLILNVLCLLVVYGAFVRFAQRQVPWWLAHALFLVTIIADRTMFNQYIIPWTSTPAAALLAITVCVLFDGQQPTSLRRLLLACALIGLVFLVRPLDAVFGSTLVMVAWASWVARDRFARLRTGQFGRTLGLSFLMAGVFFSFVALQYLFNLVVHGGWSSPYEAVSLQLGLQPATLPQKFQALFLSGTPAYVESDSGIAQHYPWMLGAVGALAWTLAAGTTALRALSVAIVVQWTLYFSYADLLPTNIWRFHLIHYLKWSVPYLALLLAWVAVCVWQALRAGRWGMAVGATACVAGGIILLSGLRLDHARLNVRGMGDLADRPSARSVVLTLAEARPMDVVFLPPAAYRGDTHPPLQIQMDGRSLVFLRDFKWVREGEGARVIFSRTEHASRVAFEFPADPGALDPGDVAVGVRQWTWALPGDVFADPYAVFPPSGRIDFTGGANRAFLRSGWSGSESWGVWSDGREASIGFTLREHDARPVTLVMRLRAFVLPAHPRLVVRVRVNDQALTMLTLDHDKGANRDTDYPLVLPPGLIAAEGRVDIHLDVPAARSPRSLRLSADDRRLGVGLVSLSKMPDEKRSP